MTNFKKKFAKLKKLNIYLTKITNKVIILIMKTSKRKLIFILSVISILLLIALTVSVTFAFFGKNRKFEGELNFSNGIVLNYKNAEPSGDKSFSLLKLGNSRTINNFEYYSDLTPLAESSSEVKSEEVFYIANPFLTADSNSIDCYVRLKLEYKTNEFSTDRVMTDKEIFNVFGTYEPLLIKTALDEVGFVKYGDYYYLVNSGVSEINYNNLYSITSSDSNKFYIFETTGTKTAKIDEQESAQISYTKLNLAEMVDYYLVDNFKIVITIETIDARTGSGAIANNIWNLN